MARGDLLALFLHSLALWFVSIGGPAALLPSLPTLRTPLYLMY